MLWTESWRADPVGRAMADRHYNRQTVGAAQFVPTGSCLVLTASTPSGRALWVTSWPKEEWTRHEWAGAWVCSIFRNEGAALSSLLIRQAVAATVAHYGPPPPLGMITFVNEEKTTEGRSEKARPGECFIWAGFKPAGFTKVHKLHTLQLGPGRFPDACPAWGTQASMFAEA